MGVNQPNHPDILKTPSSTFFEKLGNLWNKDRLACVGLDTVYENIPGYLRKSSEDIEIAMTRFNIDIVNATHDLVSAFKPNWAFYFSQGAIGYNVLKNTIGYIKEHYEDVPVILDAKVADIGNTSDRYAIGAFNELGADALTVMPYLGRTALQPLLDRKDKGIIVLVKTSNEGSGEFQDLPIYQGPDEEPIPLYQVVARHVVEEWNKNGNCAVVAGATYKEDLGAIRGIVGDMPILIPGVGAQGGKPEDIVPFGKDSRSQGMVINSSRDIIYAYQKMPEGFEEQDYAQAARAATERLSQEINSYR